jgi:hypothetical protein
MTYSDTFLDEHRDINIHHGWWDSVYEDFARICTILGIDLDKGEPSFSGFSSQGDGASWSGSYHAAKSWSPVVATYDLAPAAIRDYAPKDEELHHIADELCLLARIYHPTYAIVRRHDNRYAHEMMMCVSEWEYCDDIDADDVADEVANHIEETLLELFRDLARWLYASLESEYEYLTSDEAVAEALKANDITEEEEE